MTPVVNPDGFRAVISSIVAATWGLSDFATYWADDPNPTLNPTDRAGVKLLITHMGAVGVDEHRDHLSDGTDGYPAGTYWTLEVGNRKVIITITAETYDRGVSAAELIDAIRTGIRAADTNAALDALSLAFVWASNTVRIPNIVDTRVVSTAAADFEFAGIAQFVSKVLPPGQGGYISTVDGNNVVPGTLTP